MGSPRPPDRSHEYLGLRNTSGTEFGVRKHALRVAKLHPLTFATVSRGISERFPVSEVRSRRLEETIELRPVVRLRGPLPIIQDVADSPVDERGVGVQGLDVPEQRRLVGEQA